MVRHFPSKSLQGSFWLLFGKIWPIWFLPSGDTLYQADLLRQALWFMVRKVRELECWLFQNSGFRRSCNTRLGIALFQLQIFRVELSRVRTFQSLTSLVTPSLSTSQTKISLPVSGSICSLSEVYGFRPWLWGRREVKRPNIMCTGVVFQGYVNQTRHSQIT